MISLEDEVIERAEASLRMRLSNSSGAVSDYGGWINTTFACMSQKSIEISVKHKAIRINGVPTRVSSVVPDKADNDVAIVVIPGNPGSIGFYDIFISTLFQASGGKFAIYGVSHAGMLSGYALTYILNVFEFFYHFIQNNSTANGQIKHFLEET